MTQPAPGKNHNSRYRASEEYLARALEVIPLGSQTFSKSLTQYPYGVSPYFIKRGEAAHVWDIDGNEYVDFVCGLAAMMLGYNDPDVKKAVLRQLEDGATFSLPHPIECEVAEKIRDMAPCAEMVRFGKNGTDATSAAIRIARAHTGRDRVAICGYHGWQDWYIATTTRNLGVPQAVRDLSHTFAYNNLDSLNDLLKKHPGEFAAVIMEPMNVAWPNPGYLESVKELAHKNGALFIFDEIVTGFRFAPGGAQELFGVTPDLATFGKGVANGHPLSIVAGKEEYMMTVNDIFFSGTFGGETLSLAAASAVIDKIKREKVCDRLKAMGQSILDRLNPIIAKHGLEDAISLGGHPSWLIVTIKDSNDFTSFQIKTLYLQEMFKRGILTVGTFNISFAHTGGDIEALARAWDETLAKIAEGLRAKALDRMLECDVLVPLFKVR
jgi:glutamate-1-semialdehyde 2,1-aminomutase